MDISLVIEKMVFLLLIMVVGVIGARCGVIDEETNRRFTRFATTIPQCAIILSSAINLETAMSAGRVFGVLGLGAAIYAVLTVLGLLMPRICRIRNDRGLYSFMVIFGNTAFMGYPVISAIYGSDAVLYAVLMNMSFCALVFTLGIVLVSGEKETKFDWHLLINPAMVSSLIAVVLLFLPIRYPAALTDAVSSIGDMVVPLSMIIIGASLGKQKFGEVFGDWRAYAFAPVRLVICPIILWALARLVIHDEMLLGIVVILAGMPVGSLATMLCIQYGGNEKMASRNVFVTTVLSVVTIPFICWLLLT